MTKEMVLENLKKLVGTEFDASEVICAFEDFEENDETNIIVDESNNAGYDYVAYIDAKDATEFYFSIGEKNVIVDVWMR